jgi:hypothetical protein
MVQSMGTVKIAVSLQKQILTIRIIVLCLFVRKKFTIVIVVPFI